MQLPEHLLMETLCMLFNSFDFFIFLVVVLLIASFLRRWDHAERWFLVLASAFFYGQWSWSYLVLIYVTICVDFLLGKKIQAAAKPRHYLLVSLVVNLGILAFFKYINLLLASVNDMASMVAATWSVNLLDVVLPVGISFYTFQSLSYTIDVSRQQIQPRRKFVDYALFVSFFPQLVAGPIVRATEFFAQLDRRRVVTFEQAKTAYYLIVLGLVKKVVLADNLAWIADPVFDDPAAYSSLDNLLALYAFAFQIYFDFSGYTDIAIGVAALLGFQFPKNFNYPYVAHSIQDFWRRWHMTLSRWLRDYLYISLGGNRGGQWRTMRNLFLTMFLGGLWHGASWNFAIWGVLHGVYLGAERVFMAVGLSLSNQHLLMRCLKWTLTFHAVCFAWIFFRMTDFQDSVTMIHNILTWQTVTTEHTVQGHQVVLLSVLLLLHHVFAKTNGHQRILAGYFSYLSVMTALLVLLVVFAPTESGQFIYFQF